MRWIGWQFPRRTLLDSSVNIEASYSLALGPSIPREGKNSAFEPCAELRLISQYNPVEPQPAGESGMVTLTTEVVCS